VARRRPPSRHGLVIVDKPAGMTSHDVVATLRKRFNERRVGHAGTLDPDATGVLLVGVGYVTRLMRFLSGMDKTYTCEVVLGIATDTLDDSGSTVATFDMSSVTLDQVRAAATRLTGDIFQVPPMVSAIKVDGRRLHELAREGIEVERTPRPVHVRRFSVEATDEANVFRIDVEVSSGTYVRSLAADLGVLLGGGAHLRQLRRHSIGPFTEDEAESLDDAELRPPLAALRSMTTVVVDDEQAAMIRNGRVLDAPDSPGPWAMVDARGALLAVYEVMTDDTGRAKPAVVLAEAVA
jgi:tRNA pseudouridine55 synthase